jgi:xanthine dehydrogenase YagR molybdenum-binding subunit
MGGFGSGRPSGSGRGTVDCAPAGRATGNGRMMASESHRSNYGTTEIGLSCRSDNTPGQDDFEAAAMATRNIYATPALLTAHRLATLDLPISASMRAPGEAVGLLALECAMDELAVALGMDPIALRIKNEPATDPQNGKPFSTRTLVPCMQKGAELFGWNKRNPRPGSMRDGEWRVGMGMSAAIRGNPWPRWRRPVS